MNRRASLELSLETAIKLLLGAVIILFIIYMSYLLISLFVSGNRDYTSKRNLELLEQRIETAQKEGLAQTSLIISLPTRYELRGFSRGETKQTARAAAKVCTVGGTKVEPNSIVPINIPRPKDCGDDSCICVFRRSPDVMVQPPGQQAEYACKGETKDTFKPLSCKAFKIGTIQGRYAPPTIANATILSITLSPQEISFRSS